MDAARQTAVVMLASCEQVAGPAPGQVAGWPGASAQRNWRGTGVVPAS